MEIETLQDYFSISMEAYQPSRNEALEIMEFYHNRHYTNTQLATLRLRQQPAETFNIIKMYKRMMTGYLSTVINNIVVRATDIDGILLASIGQDTIDHTLKVNNFKRLKTKLESDIILTGMCCRRIGIKDTGKLDDLGMPIKQITLDHVPWEEISLDPMHRKDDYSDGKYIHRWKWVGEQDLVDLYGKEKVSQLADNQNTENIAGYSLTDKFKGNFTGRYKVYNNYLVIETQVKDKEGKITSYIWSNNTILETIDLSHLDRFEYQPTLLEYHTNSEYSGVMRELIETQKSINQALIQIQLLVNTNKVFVQDGAVEDFEEFKVSFAKVNAILEVNYLDGIKIENMSSEIVEQYRLIDAALERGQKLTGMNDSFLGSAGSSASGRQVKLQQNSAVVALRYLTETIEFLFEQTGEQILEAAKVYYYAHQFLLLTDDKTGEKWTELNKPITMPNAMGQEEIVYYDDYEYDDNTGKVYMKPVIDPDTALSKLEYELSITTAVYNDTDDIERLTLEAILAGPAGQSLLNANPGDYFQIAGMHIQSLKGRNSDDIAKLFYKNAKALNTVPTTDPRLMNQQSGLNGTNGQSGQGPALLSAMGATNDAKPEGYNRGNR